VYYSALFSKCIRTELFLVEKTVTSCWKRNDHWHPGVDFIDILRAAFAQIYLLWFLWDMAWNVNYTRWVEYSTKDGTFLMVKQNVINTLRQPICALSQLNWWNFLPTFYEELLRVQIPKAQKDTDDLTIFLRFWDLCV